MAGRIRTAVVGVGHFGARHAEKYAAHGGADLAFVVDSDRARAADVGARLGATATTELGDLVGAVDAASVAVPTPHHYAVARTLLEHGIHVLVEKPITDRLELAEDLIVLAEARGLVLQVGHIERFSPAFEALRSRVRRPLYIECTRVSAFSGRSTEIDVVLDVMIHDIDLVLALVKARLESVDAVGAPVLGSRDDIANTRLMFDNGCVANVTASRVSNKTERKMRVFQADAYIVADFAGGKLVHVRKGKGEMMPGIPAIEREEHDIGTADALEREIAAFLDSVATGAPVRVTGRDGAEALAAALLVGTSLTDHRKRLSGDVGLGVAG
ncbi:MAG TPA: Gfo/Idh/MocA family oxidoreductase [Alphaproteobacteria bacterium]